MTNKEFRDNNNEQLNLLGNLIKQFDTVDGINSIEEAKGRQIAKRIINEWLNLLWEVDIEDTKPVIEEESLFRDK